MEKPPKLPKSANTAVVPSTSTLGSGFTQQLSTEKGALALGLRWLRCCCEDGELGEKVMTIISIVVLIIICTAEIGENRS